jgi:hypothetical protein
MAYLAGFIAANLTDWQDYDSSPPGWLGSILGPALAASTAARMGHREVALMALRDAERATERHGASSRSCSTEPTRSPAPSAPPGAPTPRSSVMCCGARGLSRAPDFRTRTVSNHLVTMDLYAFRLPGTDQGAHFVPQLASGRHRRPALP